MSDNSERLPGYSIDSRMMARIAVNALEMAVAHRGRPAGVIVHSDRGSQFRSRRSRKALKRQGHVARWAGSGHVAITPRWCRSSRYCRRTSSTVDPGAHERNGLSARSRTCPDSTSCCRADGDYCQRGSS
ncbi:DDE-type integrase/transposase/recombinase [Tessaracoccus sp. MC1756]|nr:DDE-type integrase/transposase/recombinase [Tessaracoccus sp. MC1756]